MPSFSRRTLLSLTAGSLLSRHVFAAEKISADVLVLGAGMAGLSCAHALRKQGYSVIALEARDRIGGRTWTDSTLGVPLDMGGAWIHGIDGNPLSRLATNTGVTTFATDWDAVQLYQGKRALKSSEQAAADDLYETVIAAVEGKQARAKSSDNLGAAITSAVDELLDDDVIGAAVRWQIWSAIGSEYGEEDAALSLKSWNQDEELPGDHVLLESGYGALINPLARKLDIRMHCIVQRVVHSKSGVRVHTNQGVYTAQAAVCTLPLGVLKAGSVRFEPALPEAHQSAIAHLNMGALDKVALRFPKVFWPSDTHTFARIDGRSDQRSEFYNMALVHDLPIIVALTSGDYSRTLEALPSTAVTALMMAELRAMFGSRIPEPERVARTRWLSDPFARGCYSLMPPGASLKDYAALARPIGTPNGGKRIFMAGEATVTDYPGTVHGAYASGLRAANEISEHI
jgi:monoamine oxidase